MRLILIFISLFFSLSKLYAGQFSMTAYVYYNTDKIFSLSESIQVWFWHNKGIFTTSFGANAKANAEVQIE